MTKLLMDITDCLNRYSNLILIIITGAYAFFTYKMVKIMSKQIIANIKIKDISIKSDFLKDWFQEDLKEHPERLNNTFVEFHLTFFIHNESSGNGGIDKPSLMLKFTNDGFEYNISPITKSYETKPTGSPYISETIVHDLGGAIFLRGGEVQIIEIRYSLREFDEKLIIHLKEHFDNLEYFIKFTDNLGKNYSLKINDIKKRDRRDS